MRIELHAFLWVTAAFLCCYAFFYGSAPNDYIPYNSELGALGFFPSVVEDGEPVFVEEAAVPNLRPTKLFAQGLDLAISNPPAPEPVAISLILSGIVESNGQSKGLLGTEGGSFQLVGVGETFLNATVVAVSADRVTVRRENSEETLVLRGSGELP